MSGQDLLSIQLLKQLKDTEMAAIMDVSLEIYQCWVDPAEHAEPPIKVVAKVAKTIKGKTFHSLEREEVERAREVIYEELELLQSIFHLETGDVSDEGMPLHNKKQNIVQRVMSGILNL